MPNLLTLIERRPGAAFAAFLALHAVVWIALPTVFYLNLPLDLIEALVYGREWQLGYDKLPPLPWWMAEAAYRVFGRDLAFYALAQIAVIACFVAVWATGRPLVGPLGALIAVLIVDGLHFVQHTAVKFNHDVIQLPFWALAGYAFHRALRSGRIVHWIVLGASIGVALWAKYFVIVLAVPLALFVLLDGRARQSLRTAGPYVAAATALAIAGPHLVWLVNNDFLPFRYADVRAAQAHSLAEYFLQPIGFVVAQLVFLAPALAITAPLVWPRRQAAASCGDAYDRRIVTVLAFGPTVTLMVLSLASGRALLAMWSSPLWLFLGLWIVLATGAPLERERLRRILRIWAFVFLAFALAFIVTNAVLPRYDTRSRAVLFPGDRLAAQVSERFRTVTGQSLAYVIGDVWAGGNIGHYAPSRPRVLIDNSPKRAPWIDLADVRRRGAVLVWTSGDLESLPAGYRWIAVGAQVQPPLSLPFRIGRATTEVGWAIMPPRPAN
jgi:4-amino-4-deoxy-L-arabinose transferase-like glycosyltransferase